MADLHEVEQCLVTFLDDIVYPNGINQPSIVNAFVKVARGWPAPTQLDADLAAGKINVTVFPQDTESKTTRYFQDWETLNPAPTPTLTLTVIGNSVTIAGSPSSPTNVALIVDGKPYVYQVQPSDTVEAIAEGLSGLIDAAIPSMVNQSTIAIPNAYSLTARVGGVGQIIRELRRQKRGFQIICWCASPAQRDVIASAIDNALAAIDFFNLPDGTAGRLLYERSHVEDVTQEVKLYRRDLFYSVEYGTTQTQDATQIVVVALDVNEQPIIAGPPLVGATPSVVFGADELNWEDLG